jgi:hypothetical protein
MYFLEGKIALVAKEQAIAKPAMEQATFDNIFTSQKKLTFK